MSYAGQLTRFLFRRAYLGGIFGTFHARPGKNARLPLLAFLAFLGSPTFAPRPGGPFGSSPQVLLVGCFEEGAPASIGYDTRGDVASLSATFFPGIWGAN